MRLSTGQVEGGMRRLPERFADRLTARDMEHTVGYRDAGAWDMTVLNLIAALHHNGATISDREARSLRDYLETFRPVLSQGNAGLEVLETATRLLDELRVIPSLTDEQMKDRLRTFAERFRGRISDEAVEDLVIRPEDEAEPEVWPDTAEILVKELRREQATVTEQERNELWMLLDALNLSRKEWVRLPVA